MITVLSYDEQRKAVVAEARDGFSDYPLHLVLDSAHAVVNRP